MHEPTSARTGRHVRGAGALPPSLLRWLGFILSHRHSGGTSPFISLRRVLPRSERDIVKAVMKRRLANRAEELQLRGGLASGELDLGGQAQIQPSWWTNPEA